MLKFLKPITPSQRQVIKLNLQPILKKKPLLKKKIKSLKNFSGKNKGGGHKKRYRQINFFKFNNSTGIICSLEYDPFRKANIASVFEIFLHFFFYILAPQKLKIGDIIKCVNEKKIAIQKLTKL